MEEPADFRSPEDACEHFLLSEKHYVDVLLRRCEDVQNRLIAHIHVKRTIIKEKDLQILFANFVTIHQQHKKLFDDLMKLRMGGKEHLVQNLGSLVFQYIPFFRMYTEYNSGKSDRQDVFERLSKNSKKWKEFCLVEEKIIGITLKKLLKAPLDRLPEYLSLMSKIHRTFNDIESKPAMDIFQCVKKFEKLTQEILVKSRDMKARQKVLTLQKRIFQNKIKLVIASRYVVKWEELKIWSEKQKGLVIATLMLFNDIIILAVATARFRKTKLNIAWPLCGLRISADVSDLDTDDQEFRFSVTRMNPDGEVHKVVLVCEEKEQQDTWVHKIWEIVDRAEHCRRPVNPVQLHRRLHDIKTDAEGSAETIQITDPVKLNEIEQWEERQKTARLMKRKTSYNRREPTVIDGSHEGGSSEHEEAKLLDIIRKPKPPPTPPQRPPAAPPQGYMINSMNAALKREFPRSSPIKLRPKTNAVDALSLRPPPSPPGSKRSSPEDRRTKSLRGRVPPIRTIPLSKSLSENPPKPPNRNIQPPQILRPNLLADIGRGVKLEKKREPARKSALSGGLLNEIESGCKLRKVSKKLTRQKTVKSPDEMNRFIARYRKHVVYSDDEETKSDSSEYDWD